MGKLFLAESKFDFAVRRFVKDIVSLVKYKGIGSYTLPVDVNSDELVYTMKGLDNPITLDVDLFQDELIDTVEVDADYYRDEDLIEVTVVMNPHKKDKLIQKLIGKLNETIRHELEHISQYQKGYVFPKEPNRPIDYYLQTHELEAQKTGFRRRAKKEKREFEDVAREWYDENKKYHRLKPHEVERVIYNLLEI